MKKINLIVFLILPVKLRSEGSKEGEEGSKILLKTLYQSRKSLKNMNLNPRKPSKDHLLSIAIQKICMIDTPSISLLRNKLSK